VNLLPIFVAVRAAQTTQMVDSSLESTRVFWRQKYFNATEAEARDPRPFAQVLAERAEQKSHGRPCDPSQGVACSAPVPGVDIPKP
jgi:hypothetical protein